MIFQHPAFLWILPLALIPLIREWRRQRGRGCLSYSSVEDAAKSPASVRIVGHRSLAFFRALAIALAVVALARPQAGDEQSKVRVEGIAIELLVDNSGSMAQQDLFYENKRMGRLDAAKRITDKFVQGRTDDLIGLTVFSAYPNEICPLTLDYGMIAKFFDLVNPDPIFPYTAIGDGIVQAAALLKETPAKSKVMVLLTDGMNNFGVTHPLEAARMAGKLGIKIYAVGIVPDQAAESAVDFFARRIFRPGQEIDESLLKQVAAETGGRYFSASDGKKLEKIFSEINRLEKSQQITEKYLQYRELYHSPLAASLGLVFAESILGISLFRKKP